MSKIGYCCINIGINEGLKKKDHVLVNRGMIKKTFESKGLNYVSELVILNLKDTLKILDYNIKNDIFLYRLSSDSFPWFSNYEISKLPNFSHINFLLIKIGNKIKSNNLRVSYHPGPFNVLSSENESVVLKTIDELNKHGELFDLMGLDQSTYYPINIHIGTTKPSLEVSAKKFCDNFKLLSNSCKKRLTIENDDSVNQFSVKMLYDMVYENIGIPIVCDSLHYQCHSNDMSWEDTLRLANSTWKTKQLCHHSSSKKIFEDSNSRLTAHADFLYEKFDTLDLDLDIELECKMKDVALIDYVSKFI